MYQNENIILEKLKIIEELITSLHIKLIPAAEVIEEELLIRKKNIYDDIPSFLRKQK